MQRKIITTADGSSTIFVQELNEHYHSHHGAIQEARHVFIKMGLQHLLESRDLKEVCILEMGFGTGLNTFMTLQEAKIKNIAINYTAIEAFPISLEERNALNYPRFFTEANSQEIFNAMHESHWESKNEVSRDFFLEKKKLFFSEIKERLKFDLIYFDAFGPQVQPELWTVEIFKKMFEALKNGGILVTYSAKGSVRRAMQEAGLTVERLPGPPGKREMLRAKKL